MKAITQRKSVVTYIKSCLILQIPMFMLLSKYCVISPFRAIYSYIPVHIHIYMYLSSLSCSVMASVGDFVFCCFNTLCTRTYNVKII